MPPSTLPADSAVHDGTVAANAIENDPTRAQEFVDGARDTFKGRPEAYNAYLSSLYKGVSDDPQLQDYEIYDTTSQQGQIEVNAIQALSSDDDALYKLLDSYNERHEQGEQFNADNPRSDDGQVGQQDIVSFLSDANGTNNAAAQYKQDQIAEFEALNDLLDPNKSGRGWADSGFDKQDLLRDLNFGSQEDLNSYLKTTGAPGADETDTPDLASVEVKPGATQQTTIDVDGEKRDVWLHLPANYDPGKPMPLMLVFNGVGGGGEGMEEFTGMSERADSEGFAVAYLNGSGVGNSYNNHQGPFDNGADDVKYTSNVIDTLKSKYSIDPNRVGLVGFSQGGSFAHLAASELSDKVSSVADVEGWMTGEESNTSSPVSALSIHGTDDRIVPFDGTKDLLTDSAGKALLYLTPFGPITDLATSVYKGLHGDSPVSFAPLELAAATVQELGDVYIEPQSYTVNQYRENNQTSGQPQVDTQGNVTRTVYNNSDTGATVEQIALQHGQHAWAGSTDHRADIPLIGEPSNDVNATDEIVDFFLTHPKAS